MSHISKFVTGVVSYPHEKPRHNIHHTILTTCSSEGLLLRLTLGVNFLDLVRVAQSFVRGLLHLWLSQKSLCIVPNSWLKF